MDDMEARLAGLDDASDLWEAYDRGVEEEVGFAVSNTANHQYEPDDRERRRNFDIVLPDARNSRLTGLKVMLFNPAHGQVGRVGKATHHPYDRIYSRDRVLAVMVHALLKMKKEDFKVFEPNFNIQPTDSTPPIWPPGRNHFDMKQYKIDQKDFGPSIRVFVKIIPNGAQPSAESISVYDVEQKTWVPWSKWLPKRASELASLTLQERWMRTEWKNTKPFEVRMASRKSYNAQRMWYTLSGGFPIFRLPIELRKMIYVFALGEQVYPVTSPLVPTLEYNFSEARLLLGHGYRREWYEKCVQAFDSPWRSVPEAWGPIEKPNLSLLQVNKQIHREMCEVAWLESTKHFFLFEMFMVAPYAQAGPAMRFRHDPLHPAQTHYLSKIELNFTNKEYFEMFGVQISPSFRFHKRNSFGGLLHLEGLKSLTLRFRSIEDGWSGSPWGDIKPWRGPTYECCQKIVVDWICTFFWPYVAGRGIKVSFAGAIKKETKDKWHAIYNRGAFHDHGAAMTAIFATPEHQLPPLCACRTLCEFTRETRIDDEGLRFNYVDNFDNEDDEKPYSEPRPLHDWGNEADGVTEGADATGSGWDSEGAW